ncbi:hypothetical protein XENOCAPTIV_014393, partial [Xenoophorus captivus]
LVGQRGSLYSILGMHEATNYQSNLDHLPVQVSDTLLEVLGKEGKLTFLQLYVDSPHVHVKMPYKHPVSGAIVTCRLSHPNFQTAMLSRANTYLKHMEDLKDKLVLQLGMRIEQVRHFEEDIPSEVFPESHFCKEAIFSLLSNSAIVIPFKDSVCPNGLLPTLNKVMDHVIRELRYLYNTSEGVAKYDPCWKAFQLELALEEVFFGHPLSKGDYQVSVSLGTSTVNPKSLTHTRGFIGLASHSSASVGESPPPLDNWTKNDLQRQHIERIFPLCQTLEASPAVIGVALVKLLLCDIYRRNTDIPMSALYSDAAPRRLTGSQDLVVLCEDLSTKNSFPAPLTFGRARSLLVEAGIDVKNCLLKGFISEKMKFFPAIKFRDLKDTRKVYWNCRDYILLEVEGNETLLSKVVSATLQVCTEVERRSLSYSRNLEKYREHGMV